jgi:hypothetical protein
MIAAAVLGLAWLVGHTPAAQVAATAPSVYDLSTPRSAAQSFLRAVDAADAAGVRQAMLSQTPEQAQLADAFAALIVAGRRVGDAARSRWGGAQMLLPIGGNAVPATQPVDVNNAPEHVRPGSAPEDAASMMADAQVSIDGDQASVTPGGDVKVMRFYRVDDRWLLDVGDYAGLPDGAPAADAADQVNLIHGVATALNDAADEIIAEKYPTAGDAEMAIQQKLRAVVSRTYRAHNAQTTNPAQPSGVPPSELPAAPATAR